MKLRAPWQKAPATSNVEQATPLVCTHPRVEVEMHGTAVKRRWCAVCGEELPVQERAAPE
jgi:hypothetical protein